MVIYIYTLLGAVNTIIRKQQTAQYTESHTYLRHRIGTGQSTSHLCCTRARGRRALCVLSAMTFVHQININNKDRPQQQRTAVVVGSRFGEPCIIMIIIMCNTTSHVHTYNKPQELTTTAAYNETEQRGT